MDVDRILLDLEEIVKKLAEHVDDFDRYGDERKAERMRGEINSIKPAQITIERQRKLLQ